MMMCSCRFKNSKEKVVTGKLPFSVYSQTSLGKERNESIEGI
jgi:hypothetical protein